ncbi:MAG: hypothetical protein ACE5JP_03445 [Candidatus Bipolaricaulia bacterium]
MKPLNNLGEVHIVPLPVRLWPGKIREPDIFFIAKEHADRVGSNSRRAGIKMGFELPVPGMDPQSLTSEEYHALTPEKLELYEGYLLDPPEMHEGRRKLLAALLKNEGLISVVRLVPPERWREALQQAYDTEDS